MYAEHRTIVHSMSYPDTIQCTMYNAHSTTIILAEYTPMNIKRDSLFDRLLEFTNNNLLIAEPRRYLVEGQTGVKLGSRVVSSSRRIRGCREG